MYMVFPLDVWVYGLYNHQAQNHYLGEQRAISTFSKKWKMVKSDYYSVTCIFETEYLVHDP